MSQCTKREKIMVFISLTYKDFLSIYTLVTLWLANVTWHVNTWLKLGLNSGVKIHSILDLLHFFHLEI